MKAMDEPCTTIADEEDDEFPGQSTNERKDNIKECDKDRSVSWSTIQGLFWTGKAREGDDSHKAI